MPISKAWAAAVLATKKPRRRGFFKDQLSDVFCLAANAPDKDCSGWCVIDIFHRIGGLTKDDGLDAKTINDADAGTHLLANHGLRQTKAAGAGGFDCPPIAAVFIGFPANRQACDTILVRDPCGIGDQSTALGGIAGQQHLAFNRIINI